MLKKIKIFIASSINDLKIDRVEIGNFFRQLNEIYLDNGIHFSLIMCEDYDNSIANGGKQSVYDDEIRDSELCFFLFFTTVGEYTKHEFEVALESYQKSEKPKIVTYFKYVDNLNNITSEVRSFMHMLDGELKHYYNTYDNIDALKLGMLMQIKLMKLDSSSLEIENGIVMLNGKTIADTKNIPMFYKNSDLAEFKAAFEKITTKYYELRASYAENPDEPGLYEKYSEAAKERTELDEKIKTVEKQLLTYALKSQEELSKNTFTSRQREGYRLMEMGDYQGALKVLSKEEIYKDIIHDEEIVDSLINERIMTRIKELNQRIDVLSAGHISAEVSKEINEIYDVIYQKIVKYNLKKDLIFSYAIFMYEQKSFEGALNISEKLKYYYESPDEKVSEYEKMKLYKLLGSLYIKLKRMKEAEETLLSAMNIAETLAKREPKEYEFDLALVYEELAVLYYETNRINKAEEVLTAEFKIAKKVYENKQVNYASRVAACFNNLARIYTETNREKEAEKLYQMSIDCTNMLLKQKGREHLGDASVVYSNLGCLYMDQKRYKESEKMFLSGLEIIKKKVDVNPEKNLPDLADIYNNMGILYMSTNSLDKAVEVLTLSLDIRKKFAERNPDVYNDLVAQSYYNFALAYKESGKNEECEKMLLKALEVLNESDKNSFDIHKKEIADIYSELGLVYQRMQRYKDAEKMFLSDIEIKKQLSDEYPDASGPDLVESYFSLVSLYRDSGSRKLVKTFYQMVNIAKKYKDKSEFCAKIAAAPTHGETIAQKLWKLIIKHIKKEK